MLCRHVAFEDLSLVSFAFSLDPNCRSVFCVFLHLVKQESKQFSGEQWPPHEDCCVQSAEEALVFDWFAQKQRGIHIVSYSKQLILLVEIRNLAKTAKGWPR